MIIVSLTMMKFVNNKLEVNLHDNYTDNNKNIFWEKTKRYVADIIYFHNTKNY